MTIRNDIGRGVGPGAAVGADLIYSLKEVCVAPRRRFLPRQIDPLNYPRNLLDPEGDLAASVPRPASPLTLLSGVV
jgi:hypothetical protein